MKKIIAGTALVATLLGTTSVAVLAETAPTTTSAQTTTAVTDTTATAPVTSTTTTAPAPTTTTTDTTATAPTTSTTSTAPAPATTTTADTQLPNVSLTPDKLFYTLKLWIEQIELAVTRDAAAKASLLEEQAQTRLAEAKAMADAGKMDLAQQAMTDAQAKMAEAQKAIDAANAANKDISKLTAQVTADETRFANTLTQVLAKAPDETKTQLEPVVTDLLVQVATTQDATQKDDQAKEEAEKVAEQAKLPADVSNIQPRIILVLDAMAKASHKNLADIVVMYQQNPGLGRIAKSLGLKMGAVQHAAQIQWMVVNQGGTVQVNLTSQPAAPATSTTTTAPATNTAAPAPATVQANTTQTTTTDPAAVIVIKKGEKDDEDDNKDEARLNVGKGHEKEKEHGKSGEKGNGKH